MPRRARRSSCAPRSNGARSRRAQAAATSPRAPRRRADRRRAVCSAAIRSRPMHGRADELEAVRSFVAGGHGVLLVIGEAGLGKTRLAGECVRLAAMRAPPCSSVSALDQDSGVPYAPVRRRVGAASADDRGVRPTSDPFLSFSPSGGSAQEDRLRLFQSVERSVETLGKRRARVPRDRRSPSGRSVEPSPVSSPRARDANPAAPARRHAARGRGARRARAAHAARQPRTRAPRDTHRPSSGSISKLPGASSRSS